MRVVLITAAACILTGYNFTFTNNHFRIPPKAANGINSLICLDDSLKKKHKPSNKMDSVLAQYPRGFFAVEKLPEPIGGMDGIQGRVIYPEEARRNRREGKVYILAYVNENGIVDTTVVIKGIGFGCDEEAARVVSETKFIPGMQRNKPVRVQVSIPVIFKLSDTNNKENK